MKDFLGSPGMLSVDPSKGGQNPHGGKALFVHETDGDNGYEGTDPQFPLKDLVTAVGKCGDAKGDYIFVQYFSTLSGTPPLILAKRCIHLIALGSGNFDSRNDMNGGAAPALRLTAADRDLELAGFNIGGAGADYGVEVENGQVGYRVHIHHCTIGNNFGVSDGINAWSLSNSLIDHCMFGESVTGYGIRVGDGAELWIAHNIFLNCDTGCIYLLGGPARIFGNMFASPIGGAVGWAIDIDGARSLIHHNSASECGDKSVTVDSPYRDRSAGTVATKLNSWAGNIIGEDFGTPRAAA